MSRHGTQVESVVGWPQKFCANFSPARLTDRTNRKLKVLWLVWCLTPLLIYLPSYRRQSFQALCSPWLRVFTVVTLADPWEFPCHYYVFTALQKCSTQSTVSSSALLSILPCCSHTYLLWFYLQNLVYFCFLVIFIHPALSPPC